MFRVIIAGGRDSAITSFCPKRWTTVCGQARGADTLGERYAKEHNHSIQYFPANWKRYGKAAGYIRNTEMAKDADALVAFFGDGQSLGTKHMIATAEQLGLDVLVVGYKV